MKLHILAHLVLCLAICHLIGCNRVTEDLNHASARVTEPEPTPKVDTPAKTDVPAKAELPPMLELPPAPVVPRPAELDEKLLYGKWELHGVSTKDAKVPEGVTVEFQRDGSLISREHGNMVSKGAFTVEGKKLTVVTPGDEKAKETREVAVVTRLTAAELELTNDNDVIMSFKRSPPDEPAPK